MLSVGLAGVWLDSDVQRTELSEFQRQLLGVEEGTEVLSFVLAGRDRVYWPDLSTPVYAADGRLVGWDYAGPRGLDGNLTDTVLYVSVVGDVVTLIAIPRDLQPGPQVLDGAAAAGFVRFRESLRGDLDRLDNVKSLAFAMLQRVRDLNVRAVALLPELLDVVFDDVETNASPALVRELLPRLARFELRLATLPSHERTV